MQILEAIVGLQAGDEGKGKIVDERIAFAKKQNDGKRIIVVRFQGGPNAGHTICVREKGELKKIVLHACPSGVAANSDIAIGPHVAFDTESFVNELKEVNEILDYTGKIFISEKAGVIFDYHRKIDEWREGNTKSIGTTKSGIGPFYEDNARRVTRITFSDYVSSNFAERLKEVLEMKKEELVLIGLLGKKTLEQYHKELVEFHDPIRSKLKKYAAGVEYRLRDYLKNGDHIILEGAQGTMLDIDLGTVPDVTSSHVLAPHAFPSLGLPRKKFKIYGIEKIYPTRVGKGHLPTLSKESFGEDIAKNAGEFGATTGRARRVGYPDWVFIKRAVMLNDCDGIFITRGDCVQDKEMKVCVAYNVKGEKTIEVPNRLEDAQPVYYEKTYKWSFWEGNEDLSDPEAVDKILKEKRAAIVKGGFSKLPKDLQDFVKKHDEFVGCPTIGISIGPGRGETVMR